MAGRALDFAFEDRMMRTLVDVNLDILVTAKTYRWFPGLLRPDMEIMAGIAGHVIALVGTKIP
jgi:hypothetical protein